MTQLELEEFFHDFRQDTLAGAEATQDFVRAEFAETIAKELEEAGIIDGFDACHYKAPKGMRVDGYWFNDVSLDLFIGDFDNKETLESLTRTEVEAFFKRVENFFTSCVSKDLHLDLEETSPGYGLAKDIYDRKGYFSKINFYLLSERVLSDKIQSLDDKIFEKWNFTYHVWDMSRLHRLKTSSGGREEVVINFPDLFGQSLPCLPAHIESATYKSYLLVIPGTILADLYDSYGAQLLEQNVRSFLQARANVNKGIRSTIINDPEMFFAYNNGITATAKEIITEKRNDGIFITSIKDLQIVNGGQTTASLFHTNRKDRASLDKVFVQVKLSVVDGDKSEEVIPKISEYANTQNKVNAADFFSNHPFHIRMEGFSRGIWAPVTQGSVRETKWFYERARGQYADAQAKLGTPEKKKFLATFPKSQMFTKTDMAKFENVWEKPTFVNLGAQKNFAHYAKRIGQEWERNPDAFNELYFKRIVARTIIFRKTEKIVSAQSWYNGGYRANIVAYALGLLGKFCKDKGQAIDTQKIWDKQDLSIGLIAAIEIIAKIVHDDITNPPAGISNISEWCKKEACWTRIQSKAINLEESLPGSFINELVSQEDVKEEQKSAVKTQKIDNGIEAQSRILQISGKQWNDLLITGKEKKILTPMEVDILAIAAQIPRKIPTEKQSAILLDILQKAQLEGIKL